MDSTFQCGSFRFTSRGGADERPTDEAAERFASTRNVRSRPGFGAGSRCDIRRRARSRRGNRGSSLATSHGGRSEEHTSELQSPCNLVCRLLLGKKEKSRNADVTRHLETAKTFEYTPSPLHRHCDASAHGADVAAPYWKCWFRFSFFFFLIIRPPPKSTLFPTPPLSR